MKRQYGMVEQPRSATRIPEFDGVRGLAVLAVLVAHYFGEVEHGSRFLGAGWLGVDVFFVLSGFLIGGILLDNRGAPNFFSTFYARRTFRIFPIYFATIPILLLFIHVYGDSLSWVTPALPSGSYLTYTQNLYMTYAGSYGNPWLLPTWTLAVEEQFYMLLPVVIYVTPPRILLRLLLVLTLLTPVIRAAILRTDVLHDLGAYVLLPSRWDLLFLGVIAAMIWRDERLWTLVRGNNARPLKLAVVASGWMAAGLAAAEQILGMPLFHTVGLLFVGGCAASYMLLTLSGSYDRKALRSKPLRFFGSISYGLYLIHQPIAGLMHGFLLGTRPDIASTAQWLVTLAALIVSVTLAWFSWTLFESRLVRLGHQWSYMPAPPEEQGTEPKIAPA